MKLQIICLKHSHWILDFTEIYYLIIINLKLRYDLLKYKKEYEKYLIF